MSQDQDDAILSITSDGVNTKIKINTPPETSVKTSSSQAYMQNIEQKSTGGEISHNSNDLTQIGGSQTAINKGKITNRVENGSLYQKNVEQSAEDSGEILNEVKKLKIPFIITIIAIGADIITYYSFGRHLWELFF